MLFVFCGIGVGKPGIGLGKLCSGPALMFSLVRFIKQKAAMGGFLFYTYICVGAEIFKRSSTSASTFFVVSASFNRALCKAGSSPRMRPAE